MSCTNVPHEPYLHENYVLDLNGEQKSKTLLLGMSTMEINESLFIRCCKPIIHPRQVLMYFCLLICVFLLVCLSTTQQTSGIKKFLHVTLTHLVKQGWNIQCLTHIWLVAFSLIGLNGGSCCTLPGNWVLLVGKEIISMFGKMLVMIEYYYTLVHM